MRIYKKILVGPLILFLLFALTACSSDFLTNPPPIDPQRGFWDRYFVFPLSWLLDHSAALLAGNYGLAILAVTIIIRLAVLPLMIKQLKSSRAMQAIQPELQRLRERYKNNQQKLQEETVKLFQKHNVNPLAGCLPVLIQMPILLAFYQAIMRNEHVRTHDFLWMALGSPDPYFILPLLAALTTYLQSKMIGAGMPQNPQMQMMLYIMPLMILIIAITLPSALSLYWVFGNIFTIIQTFFIKGGAAAPAQEVKK